MESQKKHKAPKAAEDRKLSGKQDLFCQEYVRLNNGADAAREAGYAPNSARVTASQLLTKPNIIKRISGLRDEVRERNKIKEDELIERLAWIVRADLTDILDDKGSIKPLGEMTKEARYLIGGLDIDERVIMGGDEEKAIKVFTKKLKLTDRLGAIEKLLRVFGSFEKDNRQKVEEKRATMVLSNGTTIDL